MEMYLSLQQDLLGKWLLPVNRPKPNSKENLMQIIKSLFIAMSAISITIGASADNHATPSTFAAQTVGCNFQSGKDIDDLRSIMDELNKWFDKNSAINYSARLMQPIFSNVESRTSDAMLMFFNRTFEEQGNSIDEWFSGKNGADKIHAKFVSTCGQPSQAMWFGTGVRRPESPNNGGVTRFRVCTLEEGSSREQRNAADAAWNAELDRLGINNMGSARLWPGPGVSANVQSGQFLSIEGVSSAAAHGANIDTFIQNSMLTKRNMIYGDLFSCSNGVLAKSEVIHSSEQ